MIVALDIHADPLGLLVAFGAGMLSFLSPCVLPLVPGYLSMVSGLSAAELGALGSTETRTAASARAARAHVEPDEALAVSVPVRRDPAEDLVGARRGNQVETATGSGALPDETLADRQAAPADAGSGLRGARNRLLYGMLAFIAGFTIVFTALGASASAVGRLLLTHQRTFETLSGVLIVVFGAILVMTASGFTLPAAVSGERRFVVRPSVLGAWAPPIMGMAFAFAWTPCIGPVLGSVLALAAGTGGSTIGGIALLLAYSLGIGVPFLLTGLAFERMTDLLARARRSLLVVDLVGGAVLVGFGILLLTGHVSFVSDTISTWLRDLHLSRLSTS